MNRTCTNCQESLPLSAFRRRGEGYSSRCRRCLNEGWAAAKGSKKVREINRLLYWPPPRARA